jgi:hypothetical protein
VGVLEVVEDVGLELLRLLVVVVVVRASDCLKGLSAEGKRQHWLDCFVCFCGPIAQCLGRTQPYFWIIKSRHWRKTKPSSHSDKPAAMAPLAEKVLSVEAR